jgi:hypothetical protein
MDHLDGHVRKMDNDKLIDTMTIKNTNTMPVYLEIKTTMLSQNKM